MPEPSSQLVVKAARALYDFDRETDNPHWPIMPSWDDAPNRERFVYRQRARSLFRDLAPYIEERPS